MGIIRSNIMFISGMVFGIYLAQNYSVPNITKVINGAFFTVKKVEEIYRKPKKPGEDDL